MKRFFSGRHRIRGVFAVFAFMLLLPACASKQVYLDDRGRAELRKQPVIHVVHYATPTPQVNPPTVRHSYVNIKLHDAPNGVEIQSNLGNYDPSLELTNQFTRTLAKNAALGNLRTDREATPLPVIADVGLLKDKFKTGSVLEVWIERWGFHYTPVDWKTYTITMQVRSRLTRLEDGKTLWNIGRCGYGGSGGTYNDRIVLADLKTSESKKVQAKIRQTVSNITVECARQLLQDYSRNKK
jgi:hypothetical protein